MAEERIDRKDLWAQLGSIKRKEVWINAAYELGLKVTQSRGGTSHHAIRFPGYENWDVKGVVSNVYDPVRKDISEAIFKSLIKNGYKEVDIWKAIRFIK